MIPVNRRITRIFEAFCTGHCKHRKRDKCTKTGKKRGLAWCPIGEWWDLNDWVTDVKLMVAAMGKME